jgi:type VI protein secretion system component Hcp
VNYLEVTMTNVVIAGYALIDNAGGGVGLEKIGLVFEQIAVRHVDPESGYEWNLEEAE